MSIPLESANAGSSHILIAEGSLLVRWLWNVGLPLQLKKGNLFSSRDDMGCTELSSCCCAEIGVPLDLDGYIKESFMFPKGRQATVVYAVESGLTLVPMQGNQASHELIWGTLKYFLLLW